MQIFIKSALKVSTNYYLVNNYISVHSSCIKLTIKVHYNRYLPNDTS